MRAVNLLIFRFATSCLTALLIVTISSFFPSSSLLSAIHGQEVDTIPPVIKVPSDILFQAPTPDAIPVTYAVTAQDNVSGTAILGKNGLLQQDAVEGDITISCDPASGSLFQVGVTTTVECSARDAAGNTGRDSFDVRVYFPDRIPPVITVPPDITKESSTLEPILVTYAVTAQDNVDGTAILEEDGSTITQGEGGGDITISCDPASGSLFQVGVTTTVECSARDAAGNPGTGSFDVSVLYSTIVPPSDRIPPVITVPPEITEEATGPDGAQLSFEVSAEDDIDGPVVVTCDHNSGDTFPISETLVTCTAADSAGNRAQEPFLITVKEPPSDDVITRWIRWIISLLSSANITGLIVLALIGVVGIALVKHYHNRKSSRRIRERIPPSAIVEIRTKGGMKE